MFRWCVWLACVAIYSQMSVAMRLADLKQSMQEGFKSDSAASSSSSSSDSDSGAYVPNYSGPVSHIPLRANYHVDLTPKHVEKNGVKLMTIDAPLIGCPFMDFSAPVMIGNQGPFELIVDTGSTSLGVAAATCTTCAVAAKYNAATTATQLGATFSSTFGDGTMWSGPAVSDSVSIGGSGATTIQMAAITTSNGFFRASSCQNTNQGPPPNDGIIGFAFPNIGVQGKNNGANVQGVKADAWFIKNAAATGNPAVFALRLCQGSGDLFLNGYDTNSFTDQFHWANVAVFDYVYLNQQQQEAVYPIAAGKDFWTVAVQSIGPVGGTVDNNAADFQGNLATFGVNTIVDSGTTVALLPPAAFQDLINAIPAATFQTWFQATPAQFFQGYSCSASTASAATMNAALAQTVVTIGNTASGTPVSITLNGINFLLQQISTTGTTMYCAGVLSNKATFAANTNSDVILGWSFMNQMIVVHDTANARIGFAPRTATGCPDGSAGAVAVTGGDTNIIDPTGGNGRSTVGAATTVKPVTTQAAASSTTKAATTAAGATTTAVKVPNDPCAVFGCPSKNANCPAGTTGPAGVAAAQCVVAYVKVAVTVNLKTGVLQNAATTATSLFTALMQFVKMNGNVAVNLDANGLALQGTMLTFTLDVTSVTGMATAQAAAQSMMQQMSTNAFAGSAVAVSLVSTCALDANGNCVPTTTDNGTTNNTVLIAAAAGGAAAGIILIVVAVVCYRKRNANKFEGNSSKMNRDTNATAPAQNRGVAPPPPAVAAQQAWTNPYNGGGYGQNANNWNRA